MIQGIDFSHGNGLTVEQIKAGGYSFVCRYLTGLDGNNKDINAPELGNYLAADEPVVLVFETAGQEFTKAQGVADAKAAQAQLDQLSAALKRSDVQHATVFFAQDLPESAHVDPVGYMRGVSSVIGVNRSGIYGDFATVKACFDAAAVSYGWQTSGGSGGRWDNRALLRQVRYDVKLGPAVVDVDQAAYWASATPVLTVKDDFGQFPRPVPPAPAPVPKPTRHVSDGHGSLHKVASAAKLAVETVILATIEHATPAETAALLAYVGHGDWNAFTPVRLTRIGANAVMPQGRVVYWLPAITRKDT